MFSLHVTTIVTFYLAYFHVIQCDTKKIVPCFTKNIKVEIHQFNHHIPIKYINCTRILKKHIFTITFELQRRLTRIDHMFESNMVVTLFAGSCSSSTATLSTGSSGGFRGGAMGRSHPPSRKFFRFFQAKVNEK
jgi:hypothetical protein